MRFQCAVGAGAAALAAAPLVAALSASGPLFYKNCTTCLDEVRQGHMPPWHADAPAGTVENERRLSDAGTA